MKEKWWGGNGAVVALVSALTLALAYGGLVLSYAAIY